MLLLEGHLGILFCGHTGDGPMGEVVVYFDCVQYLVTVGDVFLFLFLWTVV